MIRGLFKSTGRDRFSSGQKLSSEDLNAMNTSINDLVDYMNSYLKSYINIDLEYPDYSGEFNEDLLRLIPKERYSRGQIIRLGGIDYKHLGDTLENFCDLSEWRKLSEIVNFNGDVW